MGAVSLAVIQVDEKNIVTVARKGNDKDKGFVGGKSEGNETTYETMVREVFEETGLVVKSAFLLDQQMYDGYFTSCYYVTSLDQPKNVSVRMSIDQFNLDNQRNNRNEGLVEIEPFSAVLSDDCSYPDYNSAILIKVQEYLKNSMIYNAYHAKDIQTFMDYLFPINWGGVKARIIETGVRFTDNDEPWLIGVSDINKTMRYGTTYLQTMLKTCLFVAHDCFHNLWGLPYITSFTDKDYNYFKRAQMSGEIAVLCITEFILAKQLFKFEPDLKPLIEQRLATPLVSYGNSLYQLEPRMLALRLDEVLHKGNYNEWVVSSDIALEFFDIYIPMLSRDRKNISDNWEIMKKHNFIPNSFPNIRYVRSKTGAELTMWMIEDFFHIRNTDPTPDMELAEFNRGRRKRMVVPKEWIY